MVVCVLDAKGEAQRMNNDAEGHSALAAVLQTRGVGLVVKTDAVDARMLAELGSVLVRHEDFARFARPLADERQSR